MLFIFHQKIIISVNAKHLLTKQIFPYHTKIFQIKINNYEIKSSHYYIINKYISDTFEIIIEANIEIAAPIFNAQKGYRPLNAAITVSKVTVKATKHHTTSFQRSVTASV